MSWKQIDKFSFGDGLWIELYNSFVDKQIKYNLYINLLFAILKDQNTLNPELAEQIGEHIL